MSSFNTSTSVNTSRVPMSDIKDRPRDPFTDSIVSSINDTLFDLSHRGNVIEVKQFYVTTPDVWVELTQENAWAGKGGHVYAAKLFDGSVQIHGFVTGGVYGTSCFTLPESMRPTHNALIPVATNGGYGSLSITASTGACIPVAGAGTVNFMFRFMASNNRNQPLDCYPIEVKTGLNKEPVAVIAVRSQPVRQYLHQRTEETKQPENMALGISWRYIKSATGPKVQVLDIYGLEYGTKQKVKIFIYGSQ